MTKMTKAIGLKRNLERKRNYVRGRFGNRKVGRFKPFNSFEKMMIKLHIIPDRLMAKLFGSSTNGIQTMRWRLKNNCGVYK